MSGGGGRGREGRRVDKQEVSCLEILVTTEGHLHPKPRLTGRITKNQNRLIYQWRTSNRCLTLYLKPSSGTMSTNKMYLAQGMRPDRLILQCGNILLEKHGKRRVRKRKKKANSAQQKTKHFAFACCPSVVLPARFSDNHLCSYFTKGLPEFRVLQSQPNVALDIGIGDSSHGRGRRDAKVCLQI